MTEIWEGPMPATEKAMPEVELHPELQSTIEKWVHSLGCQRFNEEILDDWSDEITRIVAEREEHLFGTLGVERTRVRLRLVYPGEVAQVDLQFFVDGQRVRPMMSGVDFG